MRCRLLLPGLLLWAAQAVAGLPDPVAQALRQSGIPPQAVAIVVQGVDDPRPRLTHNAQAVMNPASVMKLVTTYAALDLLGPAYTWQTTLWSDVSTVDGVLPGNLYLKGSGDPRFVIEDLWALLRQLRVRGLRHIAGDIRLDRRAFQAIDFDPAAFDNKPLRPYNVGPDALLLNFQSLRFTLQASDQQAQAWLETPLHGLRLDNRLTPATGPCPADWKDRIAVRLEPTKEPQRLVLIGSYAGACGERALNLSPLPADLYAGRLIRALWQELGGTLGGEVRPGDVPAGATLLARHDSVPLAEIVRDINKFSNNVMARQVFLTLGNDSAPAAAERAGQRIADWLAQRRLNFPELVLDNGSGLSRRERLSAASLNRLLLDAWRSPVMPEFIASLPLVGMDGTMKKRLNGSPLTGRAHIKTGTLDGVRTAAGYALDAQGRRHAVTILINHPQAQAGGAAIDALLLWIAGIDRP